MITKILTWIKSNKIASALIFLLLVYILTSGGPRLAIKKSISDTMYTGSSETMYEAVPNDLKVAITPDYRAPIAPTQDRKIITESYFSLLVKNVTETIQGINSKVKTLGGYLVNTNISRPEQGEDASLTMRVPTDKVEELQKYLRTNSVKVVSENVSGQDITDQYTDIQARIDTLTQMKARVQAILDQAKTVDEMVNVQNQLFSIQNQVDSYLGQLKYLEGASSTSLISVNLSTDEMALPYAPVKSWRPSVIFKEAVRSMLGTLQGFGSLAIWLGVYAIIIVPLGLVAYLVWKILKK